jgi:hypothetical protein
MTERHLRENQAANVRLDNREQALGFMSVFLESEVSTHFTAVIPPHQGPLGITLQLIPAGKTSYMDEAFLDLLEASLKDGMLARWQQDGRVTMLPRLRATA